MNEDDRKRVAHGVAFEKEVLDAHGNGHRKVKLDVNMAYSVANEIQQLRGEKERRTYYQDIVYTVCNLLDSTGVGGTLRTEGPPKSRIVCGTANEPSTGVQDALRELIERCSPKGASKQDVVWLAMHQAVDAYGGDNTGVFNAAGFSLCLMRIAGLRGVIDGILVRAILGGRTDVEADGESGYYKLLGER